MDSALEVSSPAVPVAPAVASPAADRRERRVTFAADAAFFFFERRANYDRFPKDGPELPLGMTNVHFHTALLPLGCGDPARYTLPPHVDSACRRIMLQVGYDPGVSSDQMTDMLEGNIDDLKAVWDSFFSKRSGCGCKGGRCRPESCECMLAGIPCNHQNMGQRHGCKCRYAVCPNPDPNLASLGAVVKKHYREVFARLEA